MDKSIHTKELQLNLHFPSFQHTVTVKLAHATVQWSLTDYLPTSIDTYINYVKQKLAIQTMFGKEEVTQLGKETFPNIDVRPGIAVWGREQYRGSHKIDLWTPVTRKDLPIIKRAIHAFIAQTQKKT